MRLKNSVKKKVSDEVRLSILRELKKNMGIVDFEEEGVIDYDSDELIRERVLRSDYSKVYTLKDISKWVEYGLRNGLIKKGGEKEDVEMILKWIDLLGKGGKKFSV